jgi:hypothetical protein
MLIMKSFKSGLAEHHSKMSCMLIIGDQNATIGNNNNEHKRGMGREAHGMKNENGGMIDKFMLY